MIYSIQERKEHDMAKYIRPDYDWVDNQLSQVGSTEWSAALVNELVTVLDNADFEHRQADEVKKYAEQAVSLYLGQPIYVPSDDENWADARPGELNVRDTVRVRVDAYTGDSGTKHNGKRGRVTAMRNGVANVAYDGETSELPAGHDIHLLQKLV